MTRYSWLFLTLLPLLSACPKRQTTPDYNGVKQRAAGAQQGLDNESNQ